MAAKEKSQAASTAPAAVAPPPPMQQEPDLLMAFDAPQKDSLPPPSYNTNFLQPPPPPATMDAPPAFHTVANTATAFPPPPPIDSVLAPPAAMAPPPMMMMAPPAASAPSFESLMEPTSTTAPPLQHDFAGMQAMPPPPAIDEDILAALDPAERDALLEEQRQILAQIEQNKKGDEASGAAARAMAFNQRSSAAVANLAASMDGPSASAAPRSAVARAPSAPSRSGNTVDLGDGASVPLHGQEKTQQAIKDGTAVIVQCMSCQNWMQVTEAASLMFCPICQVVCPVEKAGAATSADMEAAAQLAADQQMAEELQKEEYKKAAGSSSSSTRRRQQQQQAKAAGDKDQSWYDWLTGTPAPAPGTAAASSNTHSAEINRGGGSAGPRLVAAQTGTDETQGLVRSSARVAEQKGLFACVADSVSEAAQHMTAITLPSDQEGNVHGVDSSSLLAMPDVSRQRET